MNKADLIQYVKTQTPLTLKDSESAVNAAFDGIISALESKKDASFVGFGSFTVTKRAAREGRNPRTGETIKIKASNGIKFNASKALKDAVNR